MTTDSGPVPAAAAAAADEDDDGDDCEAASRHQTAGHRELSTRLNATCQRAAAAVLAITSTSRRTKRCVLPTPVSQQADLSHSLSAVCLLCFRNSRQLQPFFGYRLHRLGLSSCQGMQTSVGQRSFAFYRPICEMVCKY